MKCIGAHVSIANGVENAPLRAHLLRAKAFAMFTRNQRQWHSKPLSDSNINLFKQNCKKYGYSPECILPHASYLINLGSNDEIKLKKSKDAFMSEVKRCEQLGLKYLNVHPGAHLNMSSEDECIAIIAQSVNEVLEKTSNVTVVIENTAGEGTNVGYRFEQIKNIIDAVGDKKRIGVCIDTCHLFASGYDIRSESAYNNTFDEFDRIIGFEWLKGMHLNDAKSTLGSRVDRHASIGIGNIGIDAFKFIMKDRRIDNIPMILETPNSSIWKDEIAMLYSFIDD